MADFFGPAETLEVLRGLNPWWAGRQGEVPPFRRLAYDACRLYLEEASFRRAVLLSGPRRVGKTTVLNQIAQDLVAEGHDPTSVMYLSLDHPLLKLQRLPAILDVYHEHIRPKGQPVTLLLDEVQYASDWELELKQLVDRAPTYRILATGSASVVHRQRLAESGVGRWMEVHMPTLSFYEFMHLAEADLPNVPPDLRPTDLFTASSDRLIRDTRLAFRNIQPVFERYLLVGGFPETASSAVDVPLCQRLLREDVVERVLKRDMTELFGIRKVGDLERLFIYLCMHTGSILAVQKCARALGANADTVANHLEALEQANLIYRLEPYRIGGKKVLKVRHKVYLVDAALRNAVLLRGEEILRDPDQLGVIVETAVLRHLYAYYYRDVPRVSYWRDSKTGQEVDVIVSSPAYLFPAEVKYRAKARVSENDGIAAFCRQAGVRRAFWVTRNDEDFAVTRLPGIETDFLQVPAHIFLYLLGQAERLLWTR
jgi:hypothetical protein